MYRDDDRRGSREDYRDGYDSRRDSWKGRDHDDRSYYQQRPPRRRSWSRSPSRSPPMPERRYRDRDAPEYHSSSDHSIQRTSSPRKPASPRKQDSLPKYGAPPSQEVILEGLPEDMTEDDVRNPLHLLCSFFTTPSISPLHTYFE